VCNEALQLAHRDAAQLVTDKAVEQAPELLGQLGGHAGHRVVRLDTDPGGVPGAGPALVEGSPNPRQPAAASASKPPIGILQFLHKG
jgi:hypothetical protein